MRELFQAYKKFDDFVKMQLLMLGIISLSWALIMPIITKLQGMLWATSIISGYLILHNLSVFLMPLFKKLSLKESYRWFIVLDILYLTFIPIYFWSPLAFLYTEGFLMVVYGLIMGVFTINYDAFVMTKYETKTFKDIQYAERMFMAVAGLMGLAIVAMIDILTSDIGTSMKVFMGILTINLGFQFYNYKTFWSKGDFLQT